MPKANAVLAVDLGTNRVCVAIVDDSGKFLARKTETTDTKAKSSAAIQIVRIAEELATYVGRKHRFASAGVSVDGLVSRGGTVSAPGFPGWERFPLTRILEQHLRVPSVVESQHNAAVLGEVHSTKGAARGKLNVVALSVGQRIAAGILNDGRLLRGNHHQAGSAGWMAVTLADCLEVRQFGCLEAYAAGPGIERTAQASIEAGFGGGMTAIGPNKISWQDVAVLARKGDVSAREIFRRVAKLLGLGIANLISVLDPEVVVFGGELVSAADIFWDDLKQTALERCVPATSRKVKVVLSRLGRDAHLVGAASMAWESVGPNPPLLRIHTSPAHGTDAGGRKNGAGRHANKENVESSAAWTNN